MNTLLHRGFAYFNLRNYIKYRDRFQCPIHPGISYEYQLEPQLLLLSLDVSPLCEDCLVATPNECSVLLSGEFSRCSIALRTPDARILAISLMRLCGSKELYILATSLSHANDPILFLHLYLRYHLVQWNIELSMSKPNEENLMLTYAAVGQSDTALLHSPADTTMIDTSYKVPLVLLLIYHHVLSVLISFQLRDNAA